MGHHLLRLCRFRREGSAINGNWWTKYLNFCFNPTFPVLFSHELSSAKRRFAWELYWLWRSAIITGRRSTKLDSGDFPISSFQLQIRLCNKLNSTFQKCSSLIEASTSGKSQKPQLLCSNFHFEGDIKASHTHKWLKQEENSSRIVHG